MKNYSIRLLTAGIISLTLLLGSGCSDNQALRLRYEAEKRLHEAEKTYEKASLKPELITVAEVERIRTLYQEVIDFQLVALDSVSLTKNPVEYRELQHLAFQATNRLSQLLFSEREFQGAIDLLLRLLQVPDLPDAHVLPASINLGMALQSTGNWDSALAVYDQALERFYPPVDEKGDVILSLLNIPARLYQVNRMAGDSAAAEVSFVRALDYYTGLADSFPDTKVERAAHANLARMYDESGQWMKEINQLQEMADPKSEEYPAVATQMADVYGLKLGDYETAYALYDEVLAKLGQDDSVRVPVVIFKTAMVKMNQGKYSDARQLLLDLKQNYRKYYGRNAKAQYAVARSFELDGNWNRAEVEYNYLIENFRGSDEANATFLWVAKHYDDAGLEAEARRWYTDAEAYYQDLIVVGGGTIIEARALLYLADLYQQQEDWPQAAEQLQRVFDQYPNTEPGRRAILKASAIYREKLDDPAAADSLMAAFKASIADLIQDEES